MKTSIRADKFIANIGLCSRRAVKKYLKENVILANGKRINNPGERLDSKAKLTLNGKNVQKQKLVYFLLNKPKGVITTAKDEYGRQNAVSLVKSNIRVYPVGRLDKNTHGLLLLTNDGDLANKLIHPRYHIGKTYKLTVQGTVSKSKLTKLANGVILEEGMTKQARVKILNMDEKRSVIEITIFEGKKRQIRRMCEAIGLDLVDLQRIKFGGLELNGLKIGSYRELSQKEVRMIKNSISKNRKTL